MRNHLRVFNQNSIRRVIAVISGTFINVLMLFLTDFFGIPLYLDTIGTITSAALGGFFPGIMCAFFTNLISSAFYNHSIFYSFINILIAIVTAWFIRNHKEERRRNIIYYILFISLIGGGLGIIFQWALLGRPQLDELQMLARSVTGTDEGVLFFLISAFFNIGLNIIDKTITTAIAIIILRHVPSEIRKSIWVSGWRQTPLSEQDIKEYDKNNYKNVYSLGRRMTFILVASTVFISFIMGVIGISLYFNNLKNEYRNNVASAADFAATNSDADRMNDYFLSMEKISDCTETNYQYTNTLLMSFLKNTTYVDHIYIFKVTVDGFRLIFSTDEEDQSKSYIGDVIVLGSVGQEQIDSLVSGNTPSSVMTKENFGYHYWSFQPVFDNNNKVVAYAAADASMYYMADYMRNFIVQVILVFAGILVLVIGCALWVINYGLIYPVKSMTACTYGFIEDDYDQKVLDDNVRKLRSLNIHTGDDIEELYNAICKMAKTMVEQMRDVRYYSESTAQMQNGLIITMADMVENRDSDTGAHIQKTAEYVRIILKGLKNKGYYAEKLTPKYMRDVEMSAPLHDVGKITIPDAVLNKPGRLTDEEYNIMKTHTTAGKHILEKAINSVQGGNYLKEARNMAAYHHERWDGRGYPEGLHGEVIPLSARVMAVADVFDALSSPRVYKSAFSLEETIKIISEGAGVQFDPKCVEVFLESMDEVERVYRKYNVK